MFYGIGNTGVPNSSTAQIEVDPGGEIRLFTGAADMGQGSDTVLLQIAAEKLGGRDLNPALHIDAEALPNELNPETRQQLAQLEPCGYGNPSPVLMSRNMTVRDVRSVGVEGAHLKLSLMDNRRVVHDAIAFRQSHHSSWLRREMRIDAAYYLGMNEWNGERRLQLNVLDLRPSSG